VVHLETAFYAGGFPWGPNSHKVTCENRQPSDDF
jgi:hypothetical protein